MSSANLPHGFCLLLVCTGNICRSPAAERLFRAGLGVGVESESAGTYALVGEPIAAPMVSLLHSAGVRTDGFAAQQLTERQIRDSDLVLAMTRDHRAAVVDMWPGAVRRTFTLLEFARLVKLVDSHDIPPGDVGMRLSAAIPLAAAQRRRVIGDPEVDDIADPYRRPDEHYASAFQQIQDAVETIRSIV